MKAGLRVKLVAPILCVVLCGLALSAHLSANKAAEELWKEHEAASRNILAGLSRALTLSLEGIRGAVELQAGSNRLAQALKNPTAETRALAVQALGELARFQSAIEAATLHDAAGRVLAASDGDDVGDVDEQLPLRAALTGATILSDPQVGRLDGRTAFLVAAPVTDKGRVHGVLSVRIDLDRFTRDMLEPEGTGVQGSLFLADRTGRVFFHPDKSRVSRLNLTDTEWGRAILGTSRGLTRFVDAGQDVSVVHLKEPLTGWTLALRLDQADIAAATRTLRQTSLAWGLAAFVAAAAVILLVLGRMLATLSHCLRFAEAVAEGDLHDRLAVRGDDELGRLAQALRGMVGGLREMLAASRKRIEEAGRQADLARRATEEARKIKVQVESRNATMLEAAQRLENAMDIVATASVELSARIAHSRLGHTARAMTDRQGGFALAGVHSGTLNASGPVRARSAGPVACPAASPQRLGPMLAALAETRLRSRLETEGVGHAALAASVAQGSLDRGERPETSSLQTVPCFGDVGPARREPTPDPSQTAAIREHARQGVADLACHVPTLSLVLERLSEDEEETPAPSPTARCS